MCAQPVSPIYRPRCGGYLLYLFATVFPTGARLLSPAELRMTICDLTSPDVTVTIWRTWRALLIQIRHQYFTVNQYCHHDYRRELAVYHT